MKADQYKTAGATTTNQQSQIEQLSLYKKLKARASKNESMQSFTNPSYLNMSI
jgi:hypothetical protein